MKQTLNSMFANISDKYFVTITAAFAGLKAAFDTYVFSDWQFVLFLLIIVGVDTLLGIYKAWKLKVLESKATTRFLEKLLLYASALIMSHVLIKFQVAGAATGLFDWVDDVLYCGMMVRESISILENIAEIRPNLLPTWILVRMKKFDESGQLKDLVE